MAVEAGAAADGRMEGYDLIRTLAILSVFLYHIVNRQLPNSASSAIATAAAHISLALLGFMSAALLSKSREPYGTFLLKRLGRIYIPMVLCLGVIVALRLVMGYSVGGQHALMHVMGFTAFFKLLGVESKAPIGYGLWFITTILALYALMPAFQHVLHHRNGRGHMIALVGLVTLLNHVMWGTENMATVCIAFLLGVYVSESEKNHATAFDLRRGIWRSGVLTLGVVAFAPIVVAFGTPKAWAQLFFAFTALVIVPFILTVAEKLPRNLLSMSGFFAALSYEFYILHFYFVNEELKTLIAGEIGVISQVILSFIITLPLSYILFRAAAWLRAAFERYLGLARVG